LNLSLLARSAKEAQGWTSPFFLTVSLVLIYAMLPGINANGPMAWVPVVNLSLAVREALCGTLSTSLLVLAMGETLLLGALAIAVGGRMARSEATLFRGA
jgi:sodium transport system permease protein